jgi:hypothetical protein
LRKHKPRRTEFLVFLEAKSADHITTKLAVAWATESSRADAPGRGGLLNFAYTQFSQVHTHFLPPDGAGGPIHRWLLNIRRRTRSCDNRGDSITEDR